MKSREGFYAPNIPDLCSAYLKVFDNKCNGQDMKKSDQDISYDDESESERSQMMWMM